MYLLYTAPLIYYYRRMQDKQTEETGFIRCRNCGEYFDGTKAVEEYYCSDECARKYARCNTCGGYFDRTQSDFELFCSAECRDAYYTPAVPAEYLHTHHHEEEESLL
jgi:hypothetical protein